MYQKVKNGICLGVFLAGFILNAQSVRIVTQGESLPALENQVQESSKPVFPRFVKTENAEQDEIRFQEMVKNWNRYFPEREITNSDAYALRNGEMTGDKWMELNKHRNLTNLNSNQEKMPGASERNQQEHAVNSDDKVGGQTIEMSKKYLISAGLGDLWGRKGLPTLPQAAKDGAIYLEWVEKCRDWYFNSEEAKE